MVISIHKRVRGHESRVSAVECGPGPIVSIFGSARDSAHVVISDDDVERIVSAMAPYDPAARDAFFARLRAAADKAAPCYPS